MNKFVLEEKHKYWDNKRTLEEYIKDTEESGYIDCTGDYEYEYWYILENLKKLNNLQSKIDKARKIIDTYSRVVDYDDEVSIDVLYEIDDALKEDENVENN